MKGLFVKDFRLLMGQKNFFAAVFGVAFILLVTRTGGIDSSASYVLGYIGFVSSFFVLSTIGYDEFDNGNAFLFTLPFKRKSYAVEKYIFGLFIGIAAMIIMLAVEAVYFQMKGIPADWKLLLVTLGTGAACLAGFLSIMIPFQLKFGAEKGRIALLAVMMAVFAFVYVAAEALDADFANVSHLLRSVQKIGTGGIIAVVFLFVLAALALSACISIAILNKKEF